MTLGLLAIVFASSGSQRAVAVTEGVQRGALVAAGFSLAAAAAAAAVLRRAEKDAAPDAGTSLEPRERPVNQEP